MKDGDEAPICECECANGTPDMCVMKKESNVKLMKDMSNKALQRTPSAPLSFGVSADARAARSRRMGG